MEMDPSIVDECPLEKPGVGGEGRGVSSYSLTSFES